MAVAVPCLGLADERTTTAATPQVTDRGRFAADRYPFSDPHRSKVTTFEALDGTLCPKDEDPVLLTKISTQAHPKVSGVAEPHEGRAPANGMVERARG
jgi:hypothetical protein